MAFKDPKRIVEFTWIYKIFLCFSVSLRISKRWTKISSLNNYYPLLCVVISYLLTSRKFQNICWFLYIKRNFKQYTLRTILFPSVSTVFLLLYLPIYYLVSIKSSVNFSIHLSVCLPTYVFIYSLLLRLHYARLLQKFCTYEDLCIYLDNTCSSLLGYHHFPVITFHLHNLTHIFPT